MAGASCSLADDELVTLFVKLIQANKTQLVLALLRVDPKAISVINFPYVSGYSYMTDIIFPVVCTISNENYAMLAALVAYGAKIAFDEDVTEALNMRFGGKDSKRSLLEWVQFAIQEVNSSLEKLDSQSEKIEELKKDEKLSPWKAYCLDHLQSLKPRKEITELQKEQNEEQRRIWKNLKVYFTDVERLLVSRNAKTYKEMYPNDMDAPDLQGFLSLLPVAVPPPQAPGKTEPIKYELMSEHSWNGRETWFLSIKQTSMMNSSKPASRKTIQQYSTYVYQLLKAMSESPPSKSL
ncbi:hypothetical protein E1B28_011527 [Marasmius oreades]|uniref:Uncharacterized protein n=1 Tax=Marasmius oreades TaxID=181124 RepID=A0A9P7RVN4_9AGAR|nr:uncharacterized protein E1B28_011527 [Marasmius oreades]KAG7089893.1 hypothetical protein E1B28_011527 [Marasmius oreades]